MSKTNIISVIKNLNLRILTLKKSLKKEILNVCNISNNKFSLDINIFISNNVFFSVTLSEMTNIVRRNFFAFFFKKFAIWAKQLRSINKHELLCIYPTFSLSLLVPNLFYNYLSLSGAFVPELP